MVVGDGDGRGWWVVGEVSGKTESLGLAVSDFPMGLEISGGKTGG